ncbi:MAG: AAA family ATPase [Myxococcota bacterium]|jgi:ABC-type cobalamin/Fe3+-siderophores transport system ATPase subunit|nr:AAA family ATPase [Myxococcota bacterium]
MSQLKLLSIELQGFRKFREPLTLELLSPAAESLDYFVLAGPNGCGKTTVLEAIVLALGRDDLLVRDLDAKERASSPRLRLEPGARLTAVLRDGASKREYRVSRTADVHLVSYAEGDAQRVTRDWAVLSEKLAPPVEYLSSRRVPAAVGAVQDSVKGRPPDNTEANRIWRFKHRTRQQQGRRVPGYKGPEPLDLLWMERLNRFWHEFRRDQSSLTMTLVNPDNLDANEWDLFLYEGERRICSIDALSSGEQELIAMAVPFITEPFDGLLLVDEPELHLHPQWQGRALRALRSIVPEAQLFVASHADDPWDDAMSWQRRLLLPKGDPRRLGQEDA